MILFREALKAWGHPDFENVLKKTIASLDCSTLPLQEGLSAGSYALDEGIDVVVISVRETAGQIEAKVDLFYKSLTPGCACPGDPTVENEQNEQCMVLVHIDRESGQATIERLDE